MIFILLIIYLSSVLASNDLFLNPSKILINEKYYSLAGLNEDCVVDNVKFTLPRERGVGLSNCESGLTCFNFHCVFPSKEGESCQYFYFGNSDSTNNIGHDRSNCTSEFYCHKTLHKCLRTKELSESCESNEECININHPNSTCYNKKCTLSSMVPQPQSSRYFFVFFFLSILIYIYYRQYSIQEAQLNRLNELTAQGMFEERRDPEIETLPPYSPPSSTFLAEAEGENDDDSRCNRSHSLISPPSYHQFPTVNINPQILNSSVLTDNNSISINGNSTINTNTNTTSIYPLTVNTSIDRNNTPNPNRLSVANPRLSFISTQSSLTPNTPPPSYSQPTTPYLYNLDGTTVGENEGLLPALPLSSTNSNVTHPPLAHSRSNSRTINLTNAPSLNEYRYSIQSNPEEHSYIDRHHGTSHRYSTLSLRRRSSLRHSLSLGHVNSNHNSSTENSPN
ncbi:hypothetical protein PIROE2DRAFT_12339 [Piromyces sp. E2]|nr:hypothetical protein PIROE2DRAFT_12339 [Piromyces sp. E2]|eukprot:OUM61602.1 hypothetical protein PIROE2DRAFT_12339 [Piromyces sp. E2]